MAVKNVHSLTEAEVLALLRDEIRQAGSQRRWAMDKKLSNTLVSETLSSKRPPPPAILDALGLKRDVRYLPG